MFDGWDCWRFLCFLIGLNLLISVFIVEHEKKSYKRILDESKAQREQSRKALEEMMKAERERQAKIHQRYQEIVDMFNKAVNKGDETDTETDIPARRN
jgi:hypothetical protein